MTASGPTQDRHRTDTQHLGVQDKGRMASNITPDIATLYNHQTNPTIIQLKQTREVWSTICSRISVVFKAMLGKFLFPFHHLTTSDSLPTSAHFILSLIHLHPFFVVIPSPIPIFQHFSLCYGYACMCMCHSRHVGFFVVPLFVPHVSETVIGNDSFSFHVLLFDNIF